MKEIKSKKLFVLSIPLVSFVLVLDAPFTKSPEWFVLKWAIIIGFMTANILSNQKETDD